MNRVLTTATLMIFGLVSPLTLAINDGDVQVGQRIAEAKPRLNLKLSDAQFDQIALGKIPSAQQPDASKGTREVRKVEFQERVRGGRL